MMPQLIIFEPLSECAVIGVFAAWATSYLFKFEPLVFYLIHLLLWFICDWILLSVIQVLLSLLYYYIHFLYL